jgi:hypothetical protein
MLMKRVLTGDAALRREERLQQREDRLSTKNADLKAEIERLDEALTDMVSLFSADDMLTYKSPLPVGHALKAARAALQPKEGNQND